MAEPFDIQIEEFEKILLGLVGEKVSAKALSAFGRAARDMIVARTRRGFGVQRTGAKQERLLKLSTNYKKYRKRVGVDSTTSPGKSNLTFSGQLLRSLVVIAKKGQVTIRANNRRRKEGFTNNQLAEFVSEQGRPFMGLTVGELRKLRRLYENGLSGAIKKRL